MNNSNFKFLGFYGVAIASVMVLFKTVSAFGENHLQAPPQINSRYQLTVNGNSPDCKPSKTLLLNILQSGIYLNASLLPENTKATQEKELSLTGIWKHKKLSLAGKVDNSILCKQSQVSTPKINSITMEISLVDKGNLPGKLTINGIPQTLEFTAEPQADKETAEKLKSH